MNIFLPYESNIEKSVQSLDDKRLNKQILECYQLLQNALKEQKGEQVKGYAKHPVYLAYKDNTEFLAYYGLMCCKEYSHRFIRYHRYLLAFYAYMKYKIVLSTDFYVFDVHYWENFEQPKFVPFYAEGSKGQPNYIRTTENVGKLFQQKLIRKWEQDKANGRPPKWTNRDVPEFYQEYLKGVKNDK